MAEQTIKKIIAADWWVSNDNYSDDKYSDDKYSDDKYSLNFLPVESEAGPDDDPPTTYSSIPFKKL